MFGNQIFFSSVLSIHSQGVYVLWLYFKKSTLSFPTDFRADMNVAPCS